MSTDQSVAVRPPQQALAERLLTALAPVFEGGMPLLMTDSRPLLTWLQDHDIPALHFSHLDGLTQEERSNVVALPTQPIDVANQDQWRRAFSDSRVLIVAGIAFDPGLDAMAYTIERLSESSLPDAVRRNEENLNAIVDAARIEVLSGDRHMDCTFDELTVLRPKVEPELLPGEWESIGAYFEVGLVSTPDEFMTGIRPGFQVNGEFLADGVSVACHRHVSDEVRQRARDAWSTLRGIQAEGGFPLMLTLEDAIVREVRTATGQDVVTQLTRFANESLGGTLTELAFSSNASVQGNAIDWSVNSQLNEGALGVHMAIGEGLTGAHIDFIAVGAQTDFTQ